MRRPRNSLSGAPLSLLDTLETKKMRGAFFDFLESEHSSENLCFWLSCEKFKKLKGEEQRNTEGQCIYLQYISPSAPNQININHLTRRKITIELTGCITVSRDVFCNAQKYVFSIMENDSFPRFINSPFYKEASATKKNTFESVMATILPGGWNYSSLSPTKSPNKVFKKSTNNNSKEDIRSEDEVARPQPAVSRRFSFGFKKNYSSKPDKSHRSSAPAFLTDDFFNVEVKAA